MNSSQPASIFTVCSECYFFRFLKIQFSWIFHSVGLVSLGLTDCDSPHVLSWEWEPWMNICFSDLLSSLETVGIDFFFPLFLLTIIYYLSSNIISLLYKVVKTKWEFACHLTLQLQVSSPSQFVLWLRSAVFNDSKIL